jgi:hypothetical protein
MKLQRKNNKRIATFPTNHTHKAVVSLNPKIPLGGILVCMKIPEFGIFCTENVEAFSCDQKQKFLT